VSIIQDALKKVREGSEKIVTPRKEAGESSRAAALPRFLSYIVVAAIIVLAIVLWNSWSGMQTMATSNNSAPAAQDVSKGASAAESPTAPAYVNETSFALPLGIVSDSPRFILNGVMQLVDGPRAIINNVIVGIGDVVDGAKVENIEKDGVTLKTIDRQIKVEMK